LIPEAQIEAALDFLRDNAKAAGEAKAAKDYLEDFSRVIKAELMSERLTEPLGAQERYAYSHIRYKTHLEALRIAISEHERLTWLRAAAETKISAWQTQSKMALAGGLA
jgi:hypothetical protein